ncbi:MAG: hypothetical protein AAFX39_11710 [Pseudomonadota bacterium]
MISDEDIYLPYPGLRPFGSEESELFFGRDNCVDDMIDRLAETRFLAVLGPSGSGKSSLVLTGLLDGLYLGLHAKAGSRWRIAYMKPGGRPLYYLARALLKAIGDDEEPDDTDVELFVSYLKRGPRAIQQWVKDLKRDAEGPFRRGGNLLILADQFEELFRYETYAGREEAEAFVALLLACRDWSYDDPDAPHIHVVITMRSEYLGACALLPGLAEAINAGLYLTPRMDRDECREAITGPAGVCGFAVDEALVNRLLNDLSDFAPWQDDQRTDQLERISRRSDQLPLMQHALNRMWLQASAARGEDDLTLTLADYEAIGGIQGALDGHANEVLESLGPERLGVAETVFRSLVTGTSVADAVRRPTQLSTLIALAKGDDGGVKAVVNAFRARDCNFLMPPTQYPLADDTIVDISHESLIRQWDQLTEWMRKEARGVAGWRRLTTAVNRYESGEGDLLTGVDLANAQRWWEEIEPTPEWIARYGGDLDQARAFLDAGAREEQSRARGKNLFRLVTAVSMFLVVGIGGVGFMAYRANEARNDAEQAREVALEQTQLAEAARVEAEEAAEQLELSQAAAVEARQQADSAAAFAIASAAVASVERERAREARDDAIAAQTEAEAQRRQVAENFESTIGDLTQTIVAAITSQQSDAADVAAWDEAADLIGAVGQQRDLLGDLGADIVRRIDTGVSTRAIAQNFFASSRVMTAPPNSDVAGETVYPHTAPSLVINATSENGGTQIAVINGLTGGVRGYLTTDAALAGDAVNAIYLLEDRRTLTMFSSEGDLWIADLDSQDGWIAQVPLVTTQVLDVVRNVADNALIVLGLDPNDRVILETIALDTLSVSRVDTGEVPDADYDAYGFNLVATMPFGILAEYRDDGTLYAIDPFDGTITLEARGGIVSEFFVSPDARMLVATAAVPLGSNCADIAPLLRGQAVDQNVNTTCLFVRDLTTGRWIWGQAADQFNRLEGVRQSDVDGYAALLSTLGGEFLSFGWRYGGDGLVTEWTEPTSEQWFGEAVTDVPLVYFTGPGLPYRDVYFQGSTLLEQNALQVEPQTLPMPMSPRIELPDLYRDGTTVRVAYPASSVRIAVYAADPIDGSIFDDPQFPPVEWTQGCIGDVAERGCDPLASAFAGDGRTLIITRADGGFATLRLGQREAEWFFPIIRQLPGDDGGFGRQQDGIGFVAYDIHAIDQDGERFLVERSNGSFWFLYSEAPLSGTGPVQWFLTDLPEALANYEFVAADRSTGRLLFVDRDPSMMANDRLVVAAADGTIEDAAPDFGARVSRAFFLDDGRVVIASEDGVVQLFEWSEGVWQKLSDIVAGIPQVRDISIAGDQLVVAGGAFARDSGNSGEVAYVFDLANNGEISSAVRLPSTPTRVALLGEGRLLSVSWEADSVASVAFLDILGSDVFVAASSMRSTGADGSLESFLDFTTRTLARAGSDQGTLAVRGDVLATHCEAMLDARLTGWTNAWSSYERELEAFAASDGEPSVPDLPDIEALVPASARINGCATSEIARQIEIFNQIVDQSADPNDLLIAAGDLDTGAGLEALISLVLSANSTDAHAGAIARLATTASQSGIAWSDGLIADWQSRGRVPAASAELARRHAGRPYANVHWALAIMAESGDVDLTSTEEALFHYALAERLQRLAGETLRSHPNEQLSARRTVLARLLPEVVVADVKARVDAWEPEPLPREDAVAAIAGTDQSRERLRAVLEGAGVDPSILDVVRIVELETRANSRLARGDREGAVSALVEASNLALQSGATLSPATIDRLTSISAQLEDLGAWQQSFEIATSALTATVRRVVEPIQDPQDPDFVRITVLMQQIDRLFPRVRPSDAHDVLIATPMAFLDYAWWSIPWRDEPEARRATYTMFQAFRALADKLLIERPGAVDWRARRGQTLMWMDEFVRNTNGTEFDGESRVGFLEQAIADVSEAIEQRDIPLYPRYALAEALRIHAQDFPESHDALDARSELRLRSIAEHQSLLDDGFLDANISRRNFFEGYARVALQGALDARVELEDIEAGESAGDVVRTTLAALTFAHARGVARAEAEAAEALRDASSGWDLDMAYDTTWAHPIAFLAGHLRLAGSSALPDATQCDVLASYAFDPDRRAQGVPYDNIPVGEAVPACRQATDTWRGVFQLGRSLGHQGNVWGEPMQVLAQAAQNGYAPAFNALASNLNGGVDISATDRAYPLADQLFTGYAERVLIATYTDLIGPLSDAVANAAEQAAVDFLTEVAAELGVPEALARWPDAPESRQPAPFPEDFVQQVAALQGTN